MMTGIQCLAWLWALFITQTAFVCGDIQFLEKREGDSVILPCVIEETVPSPYGIYLKRSWLHQGDVLYKHTNSIFSLDNDNDRKRMSVSGDPSSHALSVTISELRGSDTDRYYCEFLVNDPFGEDRRINGTTEFFLLVTADTSASADIGLVETCDGGSATLPCLPPNGEGLVVEGVSLKRQKGQAPVEIVYHSKRNHGSSPPSSSQFPAERVQLSSVPSPGGITYSVTLQRLQPDDSALYSCQLLVRGRSDAVTSLGRRVFFVSVQGADCGCSSYSTLLYALSSAVVVLFVLILVGLMAIYKGKARRRVKSQPQAPIYEEMAGVKPLNRKLAPHHLEEMESSEYRNCPVKKSCPENHYQSLSNVSQGLASDTKY